jgi:tetratricopeptide (TPR) repeat protein
MKAVYLSGGHPLALILLVQLVEEGDETLSDILSDDTLWQGEVAANIMDKVYKERLNEEERKLLQYVSLYRMPVPVRAIATAANDSDWTEAKVKKTATSLKRKSMLEKTGKNYWEESLIDNYAYNKLVDRVERHKLACQYYLDLPLPEKRTTKEDVQSLIEAYHHACMAQECDKAAGIIFDYNLDEDLDRWGNYRTLVEMYVGVLPEDHFRDEPLLSRIGTHGAVLGNLGNAYSSLGKVEKAIKYYEDALTISKKIGDGRGEGNSLGSLGNAYSNLGQDAKAIEYYKGALVIARETGDRRVEGMVIGSLGNAYSNLGQYAKAIEYHEDALAIARKIEDRRVVGNVLGNLGNDHYRLGQVEKAIEYYEYALVIARELGDKYGEEVRLGNLGTVYRNLMQVEKAIEYYEYALVIAREIGDRRNEGNHLGNLGLAYRNLGQIEEAIKCHDGALAIAREMGDRRGEGTDLENLGTAYSDLGQVEKAIKYFEDALVIGREIKDPKIISFCEEKLKSLKNSGD